MSTDATFDASTAPAPPTAPPGREDAPPRGLSALDELAAQIEERDSEEETTVVVEIPTLDAVRLLCSTVVPYAEYQRWTIAAWPPKQRKARRPNPLLMSQLHLACTVLVNTCEAIEHRVGDEWQPMIGAKGEPYTLESDDLLARYGIIDAHEFVKKLFGRDARVMAAGETVMKASGWLEDDEDDDPTV